MQSKQSDLSALAPICKLGSACPAGRNALIECRTNVAARMKGLEDFPSARRNGNAKLCPILDRGSLRLVSGVSGVY
jgi:hypothetical protein